MINEKKDILFKIFKNAILQNSINAGLDSEDNEAELIKLLSELSLESYLEDIIPAIEENVLSKILPQNIFVSRLSKEIISYINGISETKVRQQNAEEKVVDPTPMIEALIKAIDECHYDITNKDTENHEYSPIYTAYARNALLAVKKVQNLEYEDKAKLSAYMLMANNYEAELGKTKSFATDKYAFYEVQFEKFDSIANEVNSLDQEVQRAREFKTLLATKMASLLNQNPEKPLLLEEILKEIKAARISDLLDKNRKKPLLLEEMLKEIKDIKICIDEEISRDRKIIYDQEKLSADRVFYGQEKLSADRVFYNQTDGLASNSISEEEKSKYTQDSNLVLRIKEFFAKILDNMMNLLHKKGDFVDLKEKGDFIELNKKVRLEEFVGAKGKEDLFAVKEEGPLPAKFAVKEEGPLPAKFAIKEEGPLPTKFAIKEEGPLPTKFTDKITEEKQRHVSYVSCI